MYRIRFILIVGICCSFFVKEGYSQEVTPDYLLNLQLPPLERLFEGARNSSMVEFYEYRREGEELNLKTEKRKWLNYFSFYASYQYGVMGVNTYSEIGVELPPVYQYSGSDQLWYNVGATFRVSLDQFFDRRNQIRRQQLKLQETLKERDLWYDEQKMKIIKLYEDAKKMLSSFKHVVELSTMAEAQYDVAQKDYIMGKITIQTLYNSKSMQVLASMQMEELMSQLSITLLQLEILSNTKIIGMY